MKITLAFSNFSSYGEIMETIASFLSLLDKPIIFVLLGLIIYITFNQTKMKQDISFIKADLNNHITETNKKIDKLSDRFDRQSDRFDRLYEVLLKDKKTD